MHGYKIDRQGKKQIKQYARNLRKKSTTEEQYLRYWIKKAGEKKVCKQYVVGKCIVDFALPYRNLLIEVDGPYHAGRVEKDAGRDKWMSSFGFNILRVTNEDVKNKPNDIIGQIKAYPVSEENRQQFYMAARAARRKSYYIKVELPPDWNDLEPRIVPCYGNSNEDGCDRESLVETASYRASTQASAMDHVYVLSNSVVRGSIVRIVFADQDLAALNDEIFPHYKIIYQRPTRFTLSLKSIIEGFFAPYRMENGNFRDMEPNQAIQLMREIFEDGEDNGAIDAKSQGEPIPQHIDEGVLDILHELDAEARRLPNIVMKLRNLANQDIYQPVLSNHGLDDAWRELSEIYDNLDILLSSNSRFRGFQPPGGILSSAQLLHQYQREGLGHVESWVFSDMGELLWGAYETLDEMTLKSVAPSCVFL